MNLSNIPFEKSDSSRVIGVCGCGGFIGSHLVRHILNNTNWTVIGVDTESGKISDVVGEARFQFIQNDYTGDSVLQHLTAKCHVIFSLASLCNPSQYNLIPLEVIESNYNKPVRLVNACLASKTWLVHFSTSEVYGKTASALGVHFAANEDTRSDYLLKEDHSHLIMGPANKQRWSYASAKQLLERYIIAAGETGQMPYTILRPFNFIGPNMDYIPGLDGEGVPRVLACFMSALLKEEPMMLVDGGRSKRCFTYIDDVMEFCMALLLNGKKGHNEIFNVGAAQNETTIANLAVQIKELASTYEITTPEIRHISAEEFYGQGYDDSDRRYPDVGKARALLNWKANTSLRDALEKTVKWYLNYYRSNNFPQSGYSHSLTK